MTAKITCPHCGQVGYSGGMARHIRYCSIDRDQLLWAKVEKRGPNECWPYLGSKDGHGYGRCGFGTAKTGLHWYAAHRRSYEIHNGPIPIGKLVMHTCDNPPCCNPAHLRLCTHEENMADMRAKRRQALGERNSCAKLTDMQILEIRALRNKELQRVIAAQYGVAQNTISRILARHLWKHLQ